MSKLWLRSDPFTTLHGGDRGGDFQQGLLLRSKLQTIKAVPVGNRHGHRICRWSCRNIREQEGGKTSREVRRVFDVEKFAGCAGPTKIILAGLGVALDLQGQANPRPEPGDLHGTPTVN